MPFGLAVQSANRLRRLARMKLEKAEQETGRALAESQEPESRKHFGDPGRSAEHKVPMDPLTESSASGWHSGIKSGVRFVAIMPAIRAVARTSPFGTAPSRRSVTTC